jgi:hypothetical protein
MGGRLAAQLGIVLVCLRGGWFGQEGEVIARRGRLRRGRGRGRCGAWRDGRRRMRRGRGVMGVGG